MNTLKRIEEEKNGDKNRKALHKLLNNAVYGKTMEKLRNKLDVNLVNYEKDYLKWASIRKSKVTSILKHMLTCAY